MTSFSTLWAECSPEVLPEFLQRMKEAWSSELESELIDYYRNDQDFQRGLNEVAASLKKLAPEDGNADKELRDILRQLHRWLSRGPKAVRSVVRGNSDRFQITMGSRHLFAELCKSTERFIATASEVAENPLMQGNPVRTQSINAGKLDNVEENVALSEVEVTSEKSPHKAVGAITDIDVSQLRVSDLAAMLSAAPPHVIEELPIYASVEKQNLLAKVFTSAVNRRRWKEKLQLNLEQLHNTDAMIEVNKWLNINIGKFSDLKASEKDEIFQCLREIRDELDADFAVEDIVENKDTGEKESTFTRVTLTHDFDRHSKRRFKLFADDGRQIRSVSLPSFKIVPRMDFPDGP